MICPKCGKKDVHRIKLGSWWNERYTDECWSCDYKSDDPHDPNSAAAISAVNKTLDSTLGTTRIKRTLKQTAQRRQERDDEVAGAAGESGQVPF